MIHTVRLYKLFILHTCGLGVLFVLLTSELVFKSRYCSPYLSLPPPPTQCRHYRGQWKRQKKKKNVLSVSWGGASLFCWCLWYTSLPVFGDFVSQLLEGESSHISEDWGGMSDQPSHRRRQRQLWMHKWITETVHCKHFCELETSLCITLSSLF